jgi:hypothetical protein
MSEIDNQLKEFYTIKHHVVHAIVSDNLQALEEMLLSNNFHGISLERRESVAFSTCYDAFILYTNVIGLKYLIFDYNIGKHNTIELMYKDGADLDLRVKQMFESRDLNKELNAELKIKYEIPKNLPKV